MADKGSSCRLPEEADVNQKDDKNEKQDQKRHGGFLEIKEENAVR